MRNTFYLLFLPVLSLATSCSSSKKSKTPAIVTTASLNNSSGTEHFKLTVVSDDESYGYSEKNPVKVGKEGGGPANERRFLNALLGPGGQTVTYYRQGSCCPFKTRNGMMGGGLLDKYEVSYEGIGKPVIIYLNMYDADELKAPKGFTFKQ